MANSKYTHSRSKNASKKTGKQSTGIMYALGGVTVALGVLALVLGSWYGLFFGIGFGLIFYAIGRYAAQQRGQPGVYGANRQRYREVPYEGGSSEKSFLPTDSAERDEAVARPEEATEEPAREEDVHRGAPFGEERRP